jgi:hypothetical protein
MAQWASKELGCGPVPRGLHRWIRVHYLKQRKRVVCGLPPNTKTELESFVFKETQIWSAASSWIVCSVYFIFAHLFPYALLQHLPDTPLRFHLYPLLQPCATGNTPIGLHPRLSSWCRRYELMPRRTKSPSRQSGWEHGLHHYKP